MQDRNLLLQNFLFIVALVKDLLNIDNSMLWFGILSLMFVALMPFSTQLSDTYPANHAAASFFSANLFIIGLIFIVKWHHAASDHRLLEKDLRIEKELDCIPPLGFVA